MLGLCFHFGAKKLQVVLNILLTGFPLAKPLGKSSLKIATSAFTS